MAGPVAAVVPTLGRTSDLEQVLGAVLAQTRPPEDLVVVAPAASAATRALLGARAGLRAVLPERAEGAAAGFAAGAGAAPEAAWLWLLDDDCVPAPGALAALVAEAERTGAAAVAPAMTFGDGKHHAGWRVLPGGRQEPQDPAAGPRQIDWAPFSGLLVSAAALRAAGGLRTEFLLWHADTELCLRLRRAGQVLRSAPAAHVTHPAIPVLTRRVLGRERRVGDVAPWREYDDVRNGRALRRETAGTPWAVAPGRAAGLAAEARRAAATLLVDPRGAARVAARARAWWDDRRGRPLALAARPARYRPARRNDPLGSPPHG